MTRSAFVGELERDTLKALFASASQILEHRVEQTPRGV